MANLVDSMISSRSLTGDLTAKTGISDAMIEAGHIAIIVNRTDQEGRMRRAGKLRPHPNQCEEIESPRAPV